MRRLMTILVVMAMTTIGAASASAQTCRGSVPIGAGGFKGNGGIATTFDKSAASYAGTIGGGTDTTYGAGSIGVIHYDDLGATSLIAGGLFGGQVAADASRKVVICPFGGVSIEQASNFGDSGIDVFGLGIGAGVGVGFVAVSTPTVQVVPAIGFTVTRSRVKFSDEFDSVTVTDTVGALQLGVGLVLNSHTAITPGVAIPIGVEDGSPAFSLSVTFGFGRRQALDTRREYQACPNCPFDFVAQNGQSDALEFAAVQPPMELVVCFRELCRARFIHANWSFGLVTAGSTIAGMGRGPLNG